MELSIIIVNYYNKDKLLNCLASLNLLGMFSYEIIVVNNSPADDLNDLSARYPQVNWLNSPRNLGMGGGNNFGLTRARGEYILILNPDTVVKDDAVATLLNYLKEHPEAAIIGPKLIYPDGSLQYSCARFPGFFMPLLRRTFLGDYFKDSRDGFQMIDFNHEVLAPVDWLMGSCLMFKKETRLPGGQIWSPRFDERYFMYFEDTDLCRTAWSKGLEVIYQPAAIVIHDHQRESAKNPWYLAILKDKITWIHILSWFKYFIKWGFSPAQKYAKN